MMSQGLLLGCGARCTVCEASGRWCSPKECEALAYCAAAPFDVVLSDARMAGMDCAELLKRITRLYPDTIRIILSGQCSRNSMLKCLGVAH